MPLRLHTLSFCSVVLVSLADPLPQRGGGKGGLVKASTTFRVIPRYSWGTILPKVLLAVHSPSQNRERDDDLVPVEEMLGCCKAVVWHGNLTNLVIGWLCRL